MNPIPGVCLPPCAPSFTPKQGQYLAFIYAYSPRSSAGGSRPATLLPSDASLSPPDGAHARTRRTDPAPARRRTQHPAARRPASPAGPKDPTCQNLCVEVLVHPAPPGENRSVGFRVELAEGLAVPLGELSALAGKHPALGKRAGLQVPHPRVHDVLRVRAVVRDPEGMAHLVEQGAVEVLDRDLCTVAVPRG